MSRVSKYAWSYSGSLAANASATSGSIDTAGYSVLRGVVFSSCTLSTGCGIYFEQSADSGTNWDFANACGLAAGTGCALSVDTYGNSAQVSIYMGAAAASAVRVYFELKQV